MLARLLTIFLVSLGAISVHGQATSQSNCTLNTFNNTHDDDLTLLNATWVSAGALNISSQPNAIPFCRVLGQVTYSKDYPLRFELWLPDASNYTGRYASVGNSALEGTIETSALMARLNEGFAVAGSDSGHSSDNASASSGKPAGYVPWLNNREQASAWIHDSISVFSPVAMNLTEDFYAAPPDHSYFFGCSTGGAQGFALAQLYPDMFDGIYAGSPGFWYSHLVLSFLWNSQHTMGASTLSQASLDTISDAVLAHCDTIDGVRDGVLEDPFKCDFDVDSLACQSDNANSTSCLDRDQLAAAKAIYSGPRDARNDSQIYPGFSLGSERAWSPQEGGLTSAFSIPVLQNLVFPDANQNLSFFNWGTDVDEVDRKAGPIIDETSTNLTDFRVRGAKLIVSQGWADPLNAAELPIQYFKDVNSSTQGDVTDFFSLFMVPGGGHCGTNSFFPTVPGTYHVSEALVAWVETGKKPSYIVSTGPLDGSNSSRKLCPWPQTATYDGSDQNNYTSYTCSGAKAASSTEPKPNISTRWTARPFLELIIFAICSIVASWTLAS